MKVVIWSKNQCPWCDRAKELLHSRGIEYEERNIQTADWSKEQLLAEIPGARSVPQIVVDGVVVGGFNELKEKLDGKF